MSNIIVNVAGLTFRNPFLPAAGILGSTPSSLKRLEREGAGGLVTKSLSLHPRAGYKGPVIVEVECGFINAIGLANPGVTKFREWLTEYKFEIPLIASIYGYTASDFSEAANILADIVDAYELNLSCPSVTEVSSLSEEREKIAEVVSQVTDSVDKPVFAKFSIEGLNIVEKAKAAERAGASGIVAINTIKAMEIDVSLAKPVLKNEIGGLSGPAIRPIALRSVYELYREVNIPIIGCGGISSLESAVKFLMAGASLLEIGSILAREKLDIFRKLTRELQFFLRESGYKNVSKLVGVAHGA